MWNTFIKFLCWFYLVCECNMWVLFCFLQSNAIITTSQQATLPVQNFWTEWIYDGKKQQRQTEFKAFQSRKQSQDSSNRQKKKKKEWDLPTQTHSWLVGWGHNKQLIGSSRLSKNPTLKSLLVTVRTKNSSLLWKAQVDAEILIILKRRIALFSNPGFGAKKGLMNTHSCQQLYIYILIITSVVKSRNQICILLNIPITQFYTSTIFLQELLYFLWNQAWEKLWEMFIGNEILWSYEITAIFPAGLSCDLRVKSKLSSACTLPTPEKEPDTIHTIHVE